MYILGITGSFGSGKTTVAHMLRRKGAHVLDADKIAHEALGLQNLCFQKFARHFGKGIVRQGKIDRRALAAIVFNKPAELKKLCQIIHPFVVSKIKNVIRGYQAKKQKGFLVIDAPLLFEANLDKVCDCVVVVRASLNAQIKRIQQKSHLTKSDITKRVKAQMPMAAKIKRADVVIDNHLDIKQTQKQVEELWQDLKTKKTTK